MSGKVRSAKGGKKDKLKKFPRILDYLEVKYPAVFELFDDLAMQGNLTPRRGGSITFLIPDASYIKEIRKVADSDEPEKAVDMLDSLILTDLYVKPADFAAKKDRVATILGTKVDIKSVATNKVIVDDGEITPDTDFRAFERFGAQKRGNMAVWHLKGMIKYEGMPKVVPQKGGKRGGVETTPNAGDELHAIKMRIINEKIDAVANDRKAADGNKWCPMLNAVTRLLRVFGQQNDPTYHEEYRRAKCLLTMCPFIDFYLLFCNPLVFTCERILSAYKLGVDEDHNVDTYRNLCNKFDQPALTEEQGVVLFSEDGVRRANEERDAIRAEFNERLSKNTPMKIVAVYDKLDKENIMGSLSPIYPQGLYSVFASNKGLHLLIDEFIHIVYNALQKVKQLPMPKERAEALRDVVRLVHESYGALDNPSKKTRLDNPDSYGAQFDNNGLYQIVVDFWKKFGLHMPCVMGQEFEERLVVGGDDYDNPYEKEMIDVDKHIAEDLNQYDNCPMCLSQNTMAELKAYVRTHGHMPDV